MLCLFCPNSRFQHGLSHVDGGANSERQRDGIRRASIKFQSFPSYFDDADFRVKRLVPQIVNNNALDSRIQPLQHEANQVMGERPVR